MNNLLKRILPVAIVGISVLMLVIMYATYASGETDAAKEGPSTDVGLYTTYFYLGLCVLGIVLGFVITAITDPQSILKVIVGIVVILVIWGISYALAGNEVLPAYTKFDVDAGLSQFIGSTLILTYVLGILTIAGIIYTEVMGAFK